MSSWYFRNKLTKEIVEFPGGVRGPWLTPAAALDAFGVAHGAEALEAFYGADDDDAEGELGYELWDADDPAEKARRLILEAGATAELHLLGAKVKHADAEARAAQRVLNEAGYKLQKAVAEAAGLDPWDVEIGGHACAESPFGTCVYNTHDDPCCDNCLICGEPDERK